MPHAALLFAEQTAHGPDQFENAFVGNSIEDEVGLFPVVDDALVAENGQMLRNIGIGGFDLVPEIADGHFLVFQQTEDFEPYGMRHGFQQCGDVMNVVVVHGVFLVVFNRLI